MASSTKLFVKLAVKLMDPQSGAGKAIDVGWDEKKTHYFACDAPPFTIEVLAERMEALVEELYEKRTGGADVVQVQVRSITSAKSSGQILPWGDRVDRHLKPDDTIIVDAVAVSESVLRQMRQQQGDSLEQRIKTLRASLRFDLNDRVLCNCGSRWLSGHIVGTGVPDEGDIFPYLVKTDTFPGMPQRTITVPCDEDDVCIQEVCFDPRSEMHLIKGAAAVVDESSKPKTRFAVGEKVACRVRSGDDGLERWVPGAVSELWPKLTGQKKWQMAGVSNDFAEIVPYTVVLNSGSWIYCHRDDHTQIRREGLEPQERVKGISKRMEWRKCEDGSKERVDHVTERRKRMIVKDDSSSGDE